MLASCADVQPQVWSPPGVHQALRGKSFFPCMSTKEPRVPSWNPFRNRLPRKEEIEQWATYEGPWGMPCGNFNGIVVLDFDGEDGMALYGYLSGMGDLPNTWTAKTASGGIHLYFRCPAIPTKNAVRIKPGLDIRSEGGYVIVPSAYPDGRNWIVPPDGEPAPLPEWILDSKADRSLDTTSTESVGDGLPAGVEKGRRNATATQHVGRWFRKGLKSGEVLALALAWNRKNNPPLQEDEIKKIVTSIEKAEMEKRPRLIVLTGAEAVRGRAEKKPTLLEGVAYDPSKIILAGFAGSGNSLLALNLAACVSNGLAFLGLQTCEKTVLYLDAENPGAEVDARLESIFGRLAGNLNNLRIVRDCGGVNVAMREGREAVVDLVLTHSAGLLVLDSYLKFFHVKDENASTDVRRAFDSVDQIVGGTGCSVLIIDHTAKPSAASQHASGTSGMLTPRGSGAKLDFCDAAMILEKKKSGPGRFFRTLTFPKLRGFKDREPILLELGEEDYIYRSKEESELLPSRQIAEIVEAHGRDGMRSSEAVKALWEEIGRVVSMRTVQRHIDRAIYEGVITRRGNGRGAILFIGNGRKSSEA